LEPFEVRGPTEFDSAFSAIARTRAGAVIVFSSPMFGVHQKRIADLGIQSRLPTMYFDRVYVNAGGLMSYGPDVGDMFRRAATYVQKILKSVKPADLPVEQPTKFELVINLKTAKQISLMIPDSVLYRADKLIK